MTACGSCAWSNRGQISAEEGARLLDAITDDAARIRAEARSRSLRIVVTDLNSRRQKINVTIPAAWSLSVSNLAHASFRATPV
jgi:hypothetical protein